MITFAVVGAGDRGNAYARWVASHPDRARVVAVAEPRAHRRSALAAGHAIPAERVGVGAGAGHGGGDAGLMEAFTTAVETGDPSTSLSGPESLETHLAVFTAERAPGRRYRRTG